MKYYFSKVLDNVSYQDAIELVSEALKKEGFGILTQIDVKDTLKKKIDVDFRNYIILGACNPHFAHKALLAEGKLGAFLPCNVVVEELDNGSIEVSIVDPAVMMSSIENKSLERLAEDVRSKLQNVLSDLSSR